MFNASLRESNGKAIADCYRSYIVTRPTTAYIANSIIGCIVNFILFFCGTFLNALVVYVFWKTPRLRNKVSYFMIMILSTIDMLATLILHPAHLVMSIAEIIGQPKCVYKVFYHIGALVLNGMSFLTFFVMNVERYLSIVHPFLHFQHVTKLRCFVLCCITWSLTIFAGPIAYPLHLNIQVVVTAVALIVLIATCYIYVAIYCIARKRKRTGELRKIRTETDTNVTIVEDSTQTGGSGDATETCSNLTVKDANLKKMAGGNTTEKSKKAVSFLHDLQLAKMYFLVVFTSFVLNLPNAIVLAMFQDRIKALTDLVQFKIWTVTFVLMNSTVNCLIFFWANKGLRKEGWKVCGRCFLRR